MIAGATPFADTRRHGGVHIRCRGFQRVRASGLGDQQHRCKPGPVVNSGLRDSEPALSPDATELYFSSLRPGFGGWDIWVTRRQRLTD
jgi:hypothetical protein